MRKLFILFLTTSLFVGCAKCVQHEKWAENFFNVPGTTKGQIFEGVKKWIATNFRSTKAVLQYENQKEGVILGNDVILNVKRHWDVGFTMRVDVKAESFRISFHNLYWKGKGGEVPFCKQKEYDAVQPILSRYGPELYTYLNTGIEVEKSW
jgi:hypothetical protein